MNKKNKDVTENLDLSLIISAYNEESCLEETVEEIIREIKKAKIRFELIIVNNGSTDNTQEIINKLKKKYPEKIKAIVFEKNRKLGGAINTVTKSPLIGKIIGFTCADGEVSASDSAQLIKEILRREDISLIKTIRLNRIDGARIFVSRGYNLLIKVLFGIKTKDVNGWPVLIKNEDFKKMHLRDYSWIFQLEYLCQIKRLNKKFIETPVQHQRRKGGVSKVDFIDIILFFIQIISYRFRTLFEG